MRFVSCSYDQVTGWVAQSTVSARCVYDGVCEVSLYVREDFRGIGLGGLLMDFVIAKSENQGIWTLQASIFPENEASMHLHFSRGFRLMGYRERVARHYGQWRNVNLLERRSKITGL